MRESCLEPARNKLKARKKNARVMPGPDWTEKNVCAAAVDVVTAAQMLGYYGKHGDVSELPVLYGRYERRA